MSQLQTPDAAHQLIVQGASVVRMAHQTQLYRNRKPQARTTTASTYGASVALAIIVSRELRLPHLAERWWWG